MPTSHHILWNTILKHIGVNEFNSSGESDSRIYTKERRFLNITLRRYRCKQFHANGKVLYFVFRFSKHHRRIFRKRITQHTISHLDVGSLCSRIAHDFGTTSSPSNEKRSDTVIFIIYIYNPLEMFAA